MHNAASWGDLDVVKYLVKIGTDVNAMSKYEGTPLHSASGYMGHLDIVKYLVENGADVHAKDSLKAHTPLHLAAYSGNLDLVKLFIEKGANINAKNNGGDTPLDLAKSRGNSQIIEFLSSHQHGNRDRRGVSNNSWMNNSVVNWVKGLISSTESPALLTSEGNHSITTVAPETSATLLSSTLFLGILAASLKWKGKEQKPPLHENLLPSNKQSRKLHDLDMVEKAVLKALSNPSTYVDNISVYSNDAKLQR